MHIAMHAFGKITLFFCAGAIYVAAKKTNISDMRGIGKTMPITMTAFFIGALSIIGLPPMGGAWSKWFLALGALAAEQRMLVGVLLISSLLNVAYLMPIVARAFFMSPLAATENPASDGASDVLASVNESSAIKEAPLFCLLALGTTAVGCVVLFFYADALYRLLTPIVMP